MIEFIIYNESNSPIGHPDFVKKREDIKIKKNNISYINTLGANKSFNFEKIVFSNGEVIIPKTN